MQKDSNNNNNKNSKYNRNTVKLSPIEVKSTVSSATKSRLSHAKNYSDTLNTLCENSNISIPSSGKTAQDLSKGFVVKIISDVLATKS